MRPERQRRVWTQRRFLRFAAAAILAMPAVLPRPACADTAAPSWRHMNEMPPHALHYDTFLQSSPTTGTAPTRRTEIRIWHDARTLYIAIHAFDPQPDALVARQLRRDVEDLLAEDQVTLVIDPEGTGRNGYLFAVNALGTQFDALIYDGGQMRFDWDALWHSEARIEADGWRAWLTIPLSVFGRHDAPAWRLNAERWMPRGSERVRLTGIQPDKPIHSLGDAVPLPAIRPAREGLGIRLKSSLRLTHDDTAGSAERRVEPALEIFHESDDGLRSAAALNLDFGDTEVDERLVNLTRFELFRPEKREFFLRDAGRFSFGGLVDGAIVPYYSRRIGLDTSGRGRVLDAGLKLTGSMAGNDFGAFAARVVGGPSAPSEAHQAATDVAVLRGARRLDERQRVGLLATRGNPQGTAGSSLWGLDYQFRDTAWHGHKTLEAHAWAMQSTHAPTPAEPSVQGHAWGGKLSHLNVGPMAEVEWQHIGTGFHPALGYLAEASVRRHQGTMGWWHRTEGGASIIPALDWEYRRTLDGRERTQVLNPEISYVTAAGDTVMAEVFHERDQLASAYAPVPDLAITAGEYRWRYLYGLIDTSPSRPVSAQAELRSGGYYDGRRDDRTATLGWKPSAHWGLRAGLGRNVIALPAGRYTVRLATLRLDYTPSTRWAQSLLLQWDNVTNALGLSARLRWRWTTGREFVLALDRLGYTGERTQLPGQTRAVLKWIWEFER